jgi:hypothetical protein
MFTPSPNIEFRDFQMTKGCNTQVISPRIQGEITVNKIR